SAVQNRVVIVAPLGADARNISEVLSDAGFQTRVCSDIGCAAEELNRGCGAMVITEEAVEARHQAFFSAQLEQQAPWSDLPVVLITTGGKFTDVSNRAVELIGARANLILIERPLRASTLVAAMRAALRARS